MGKINQLFEKLEKSDEFKEWQKENKDDYLVNFFVFAGDLKGVCDAIWQIGYYNKEKDLITSFEIGDDVVIHDPSQAFKKEKAICELKLDDIKVDLKDAIDFAIECKEKENQDKDLIKVIVIVQVIDDVPMYNFTFVTNTFKTINVKVNSISKELIDIKVQSIMDFAQDGKSF